MNKIYTPSFTFDYDPDKFIKLRNKFMGEMADYFLDCVLDYEDWLWNMQQQYPDVPEEYLGDME